MALLIFYLALALVVSFVCSIAEAVLLSIPPSYTNFLEEKGQNKLSEKLNILKQDVNKPLSAILTLNTISHTVGAAGAGAQAAIVFGNNYVGVFSGVLTLLILIFSEIIPKTLGATYWKSLTPTTVHTLLKMQFFLYPFVVLSNYITRHISKDDLVQGFNRDELLAMTKLSTEEGLLSQQEMLIIKNLLSFQKLPAKHIMTPRTVVFNIDQEISISEYFDKFGNEKFSRIPIFKDHHEKITGFVLRSDLLLAKANKEMNAPIHNFTRKIEAIPETLSLSKVFERFILSREQIVELVDEHGGFAGILTLEDIFEHLLGADIVDESDKVSNMRKLAQVKWKMRMKKLDKS